MKVHSEMPGWTDAGLDACWEVDIPSCVPGSGQPPVCPGKWAAPHVALEVDSPSCPEGDSLFIIIPMSPEFRKQANKTMSKNSLGSKLTADLPFKPLLYTLASLVLCVFL